MEQRGYFPPEDELRSLLAAARDFAARMRARLGRAHHLSDLFSDAQLGLAEALQSFDPARSPNFRMFAFMMMRSRVLNGVRARDPVAEKDRALIRSADRATAYGYVPKPAEMESTFPGLRRARHAVAVRMPLSLDGLISADGDHSSEAALVEIVAAQDLGPEDMIVAKERIFSLRRAIAGLPERLRAVVNLHYNVGLSLREIAAALGVSNGRVSQMHRRALRLLRTSMGWH